MLLSLSLIILVGLGLSFIFRTLRLPHIIGLMLTGIILGPYMLDLISPGLLGISEDLRQIALIVILLRAGLSIKLSDLKKIGLNGLLMSFVPATFEIIGIVILGPLLLGLRVTDALILGCVLGAVSPAIVVPKMLSLLEKRQGTEKSIPQLIMAGASLDDVYCIVLFTSFLQMSLSGDPGLLNIIQLPTSIILGSGIGIGSGLAFNRIFRKHHMRDSLKVILLLSVSMMFVALENIIKPWVSVSGLLAVMSMGIVILATYPVLAERLVRKYEKIWLFAEILLFVLVGAAVDVSTVSSVFVPSLLLILGALAFRSLGVVIATLGMPLSWKERLFIILAYLPKATVQASIGAIPLAMGLEAGNTILTVSVIAILLTSSIGAIAIDLSKSGLLKTDSVEAAGEGELS